MKSLKKLSMIILAVLFFTSTAFAAAKPPVEKWIKIPGQNASHKMVFYDRDGDGKYDFVKNWFYYNNKCWKYDEGPINSIIVSSDPSISSNMMLINTMISDSAVFGMPSFDLSALDSNSSLADYEVDFYTDSIFSGPGSFTMKRDSAGAWTLTQFWVDSLTDAKIINYFVQHFTPGNTNTYVADDFASNIEDGKVISSNSIDITLGTYRALIVNKYDLFDIGGVLVKSVNTGAASSASINVSDLQNGTYILQEYYTNGESGSFTILLNK